jgi:hypothetical protein
MEPSEIIDTINGLRKQLANLDDRARGNDLSDEEREIDAVEADFIRNEIEFQGEELALAEMARHYVEEELIVEPAEIVVEEEEEEEEIDFNNPPEWLLAMWNEERDRRTNWNAYDDRLFDLADEV